MLKGVIIIDVLGSVHQFEARVIATSARRKAFAVYDCYFVLLFMIGIVSYFIDARPFALLTGLETLSNIYGHLRFFPRCAFDKQI
jgi:hypothetical protein